MTYITEHPVLTVRAYGLPTPQGSKIPGVSKDGKAFVREQSGDRLKQWRKSIIDATIEARSVMHHQTISGPASLIITFFIPRPASVKRARPSVRPDLDKMVRAAGDALKSAGAYKDDANLCQILARKEYATDDVENAPGVYIVLWEMSEII